MPNVHSKEMKVTPEPKLVSQTLSTVKRMLSEQGISYQQLAESMSLSLPTVKRMMNSTDISVARLSEMSEIEASLVATGYSVTEVRDAPDRPGMEFVFVAEVLDKK